VIEIGVYTGFLKIEVLIWGVLRNIDECWLQKVVKICGFEVLWSWEDWLWRDRYGIPWSYR
jgi:hypothetical protein